MAQNINGSKSGVFRTKRPRRLEAPGFLGPPRQLELAAKIDGRLLQKQKRPHVESCCLASVPSLSWQKIFCTRILR